MTGLWMRLLACSCLLWTVRPTLAQGSASRGTYFVTFSKTVRAGITTQITAFISGATGPVSFRVELFDYDGLRVQKGQTYSLNPPNGLHKLAFPFSENLKRPMYFMYFLRVICWGGGLKFDQVRPLHWRNRQISVLIQTDKNVYKPGDTVRFRAFGMRPDLTVSGDPMELTILDPLDNMVGRFTGNKNSRVLSDSIQLPPNPRLGLYTIRARISGGARKKYFLIQKYDTPAFEVLIWVPRVDTSDTVAKVRVIAKYLLGTPISGSGVLRVLPTYVHLHGRAYPYKLEKSFTLDKKGQAVVWFNVSDLGKVVCYANIHSWYRCSYSYVKNYATYSYLRFEAAVKDHNSYKYVKRTKDIRLTSYRSYLRFVETQSRYKPGLPYDVNVQDTKSNGRPVRKLLSKSVNITIYYRLQNPNRTDCYGTIRHTVTVGKDFDPFTKIASFTVPKIPETTCSAFLVARDGKRYTCKYLYRFYSPSKSYLYIAPNRDLEFGRNRKIIVKSNKPFKEFTYSIFSRGELILTKTETKFTATKETWFQFEVTKAMAPKVHIIVYSIATSNEVIATSVSLPVEYYPYDMNVLFKKQKEAIASPGSQVQLNIATLKSAEVFLLGRDQRMLTRSNDLKSDDVAKALMAHDVSPRYFGYEYSARDAFRNSGVGVISNMYHGYYSYYYLPRVFQYRRYWYYYYYKYYYYHRCRRYVPRPGPPARYELMARLPVRNVRFFRPDTWIWASLKLKRGKAVLKVRAPDSVTKLNVSAYAVHPKLGLSLLTTPIQLTTTKRLYATMFLLRSAIRNEVVCFNAIAHNFDNTNHNVTMKIDRSSEFLVAKLTKVNGAYTESYESAYQSKHLGVIPPGQIRSATFCIKLQALGDVKVRVAITGDVVGWDDLVKYINVQPEGIHRSRTFPVLLELTPSNNNVSTSFDVKLPPLNIVPNSYQLRVALSGDVLGTAVQNMGELLKRPTGSGAQNMVHMAPNIYIVHYLKRTGRFYKFLAKARSVSQAGYHQQMVFQRYDGAFSPFGNWDLYGSTWLSSFVLKVFAQASASSVTFGINPEPDMMRRAAGFVTEKQKPDGSFRELGKNIHDKLQGLSAASDLRFTAFVAIALMESEKFFQDNRLTVAHGRVLEAKVKALVYLTQNLNQLGASDPYSSCIVSYALALAGWKNATNTAIGHMNSAAVNDGGNIRYWKMDGSVRSENIEMSGYALLAYFKTNQLGEAIKVYRWLNTQKGPFGGFGNTQATVIGLQALAAMHSVALEKNFNDISLKMTVHRSQQPQYSRSVSGVITKRGEVVIPQNPDLKWPNEYKPGRVTVRASANVPTGKRYFVMAQVTVKYHLSTLPARGGLTANVTVSSQNAHSFVMKTCIKRAPRNTTNDPVMVSKFHVPTAFSLDKNSSQYGWVNQVALNGGHVVMYHYGSQLQSCFSLKLRMTKGRVAYIQPPLVHIYNAEYRQEEIVTRCQMQKHGICAIRPDLCP